MEGKENQTAEEEEGRAAEEEEEGRAAQGEKSAGIY